MEKVDVFARSFENHNDDFNTVEEVDNQLHLETTEKFEEKVEAVSGSISVAIQKDCAEEKDLEQDGFSSHLQQIDVETELEAFFKLVKNDKTSKGVAEFYIRYKENIPKHRFSRQHNILTVIFRSFDSLFHAFKFKGKIDTSKVNLLPSSESPLMLPLSQTTKKLLLLSKANDYSSSSLDCFPIMNH